MCIKSLLEVFLFGSFAERLLVLQNLKSGLFTYELEVLSLLKVKFDDEDPPL